MRCITASAQTADPEKPPARKPAAQAEKSGGSAEEDPFAGVTAASKPQEAEPSPPLSWKKAFFTENLGFRKEIMSQFGIGQDGHGASRQSVGFEVLKKFSTATSTVASFD